MSGADAIELEIFRHLFASIAEEMGVRLMRSAYSPNIKERRDYSCALFDGRGEMIAQAAHIPVHLGSTPMSVAAAINAFSDNGMSADDVIVLNDPFSGGTHLPDITLVAPVFVAGETTPRFYVANRAHHADVGGISPGSLPLSRTIDEEGVRIAPQRLDDACVAWIASESRTPDERRGDLLAQIAAISLGRGRLIEMCDKYGPTIVSERAADLQAYAARLTEAIIGNMPDGHYRYEDQIDDDGLGTTAIKIVCTLRIEGPAATVDLRDSAAQCAGPLNAVRAIAVSAVNYAFRCLAPADLPDNGGVMRPITVLTKPGTVVDALPPSAVAAGNVETSQRLVDVVFGALAQALPDQIPAASGGTMNNVTIGGQDPRTGGPYAYYETIGNGSGAGPGFDGASAMQTHMTNTLNTPVEALEHAYPFQVSHYAIRRGSGGAGLHQGGDGLIRTYRFTSPAEVTVISERRRSRPYGLAGGKPGSTGRNTLRRAGGEPELLLAKVTVLVDDGDEVQIATPGGGGFGSN